MVGWYHQLDGHEFEQTLGDGEGQGSLQCCSPWGHRAGRDLAIEQQLLYIHQPGKNQSHFIKFGEAGGNGNSSARLWGE